MGGPPFIWSRTAASVASGKVVSYRTVLHNIDLLGGTVDSQIVLVIDRFNAMLSGDDVTITVEEFVGGELTLRYGGAVGGDCETCVLSPEDLEALIGEALIGKASGVTSVRVAQ
jgi:Fe-S cluster biogenesis protein NfuA